MRRIVLVVFLATIALLYIMKQLELSSQLRFFIGAFGFGTSVVLLIVLPLMTTYKDEP